MITNLKGEIDNNTKMVGEFTTPLSTINRSSRHKINKETLYFTHSLDQMDLIDIYRALHPTAEEHTFFSIVHEIFSKIDHMIEHKISVFSRRVKS